MTMTTKQLLALALAMASLSLLPGCSAYEKLPPMQSMREDLSYPFAVKYVDLQDDVSIAYVDEGQGEKVLLFVHGLGSYLPAWTRNIEALKDDFRCIAIDLPGYGKSSKAPHSGQMTYYADVVAEFIDSLGLGQVSMVGHSMGGQISMTLALRHPSKVQRLVLAAPAGFERFHPGQKAWFRDVMSVRGVKLTPVEAIQNNLAHNFYNMPAEADFMIRDRIAMRSASDFDNYCHAVVRSVHGMVDQAVIDKLGQIRQPTLIVFGENDNLIPNRYLNPGRTVEIAEYGQSQIQGSQLVMIPKAGHFVQFEKAEIFNQSIRDFFSVQ